MALLLLAVELMTCMTGLGGRIAAEPQEGIDYFIDEHRQRWSGTLWHWRHGSAHSHSIAARPC